MEKRASGSQLQVNIHKLEKNRSPSSEHISLNHKRSGGSDYTLKRELKQHLEKFIMDECSRMMQ